MARSWGRNVVAPRELHRSEHANGEFGGAAFSVVLAAQKFEGNRGGWLPTLDTRFELSSASWPGDRTCGQGLVSERYARTSGRSPLRAPNSLDTSRTRRGSPTQFWIARPPGRRIRARLTAPGHGEQAQAAITLLNCRTNAKPGERVMYSTGLHCRLRSPSPMESVRDEGR